MGISDLGAVRSTSDKGRSFGAIFIDLLPNDDDEPFPSISGWDLWEKHQRYVSVVGQEPVSYNAFKQALQSLKDSGVIEVTGMVKGRSKRSIVAKLFRITDFGYEWFTTQGDRFITGKEKEANDIPVKAISFLRKLSSVERPVTVKNGDNEVWKAWRWLRNNGYIQSLVRITPEGRAYLASVEGKKLHDESNGG